MKDEKERIRVDVINPQFEPSSPKPDTHALAQVALYETLRQEGVAQMATGLAEKLGVRKTPGVVARIDEEGWLHIDIAIVAGPERGWHCVGATVQQAVIAAIRKVSNQPIGRVNVRIRGPAAVAGVSPAATRH
jgi:uncharacterized alkaline shock family protein YloU